MRVKEVLRSPYDRLPLAKDLREIRNEILELKGVASGLRTTAATTLQDFLLESHTRYGDPKRLLRYAAQVCSQNGEDGIIHEIFRRIGTTSRDFVEVGVGDGFENNSAFLLSQGWHGFWIDGSEDFIRNLERRADLRGDFLRGTQAFVTKESIAPPIQKAGDFGRIRLSLPRH